MQTVTIKQLPVAAELADEDVLPLSQGESTKKTDLSALKEFIQADIPEILDTEREERIQGDSDTLRSAKEYTDQIILGGNEWLPPVNLVSQLPVNGLEKERNYLCKVVADSQSGVYQAVGGWSTHPTWVLYNDTVDLVNEQELQNAIEEHNAGNVAHFNSTDNPHNVTKSQIGLGNIDNTSDINKPVSAAVQNILNNLIGLPVFDDDSYTLTFNAINGASLTVDLPIELLANASDVNAALTTKADKVPGAVNGNFAGLDAQGNLTDSGKNAGIFATVEQLENLSNELGTSVTTDNIEGSPNFLNETLSTGGFFRKVWRGINWLYSSLTTHNHATGNRISFKDLNFPPGHIYYQYPNDGSPAEEGYPGTWENWTKRAEMYELIPSSSFNSLFASTVSWTGGRSIVAGQNYIWTPGGNSSTGTRRLIRAKESMSGSQQPLKMNPVEFYDITELYGTPLYKSKKELQGNFTSADYQIGAEVNISGVNYKVTGVITMEGLYDSYEGGNRGSFKTGIKRDEIRDLSGSLGMVNMYLHAGEAFGKLFYIETLSQGTAGQIVGQYSYEMTYMKASRVVPAGNENSVRTMPKRIWRKVA